MENIDKIKCVLIDFEQNEKTLDEAANEIFRLFSVVESDCDHEWLNHSFDHFGFLQEQICDKCGAKQSVP
jgi:hypothetical protein